MVTPYFPSRENWWGAYCYDYAKALLSKNGANAQLNLVVFVPNEGDREVGGIRVYGFRERRLPGNVFPFLFAAWNRRSFLRAVAHAGIKLKNVSVCHAHTAWCGIYPLAVKEKNPQCLTLLHHHDLASFGLNMGFLRHCWLYNLIQFPVLRQMHERLDCHVFISELSRKSFLAAPDAGWSVYRDYRRQMRGLPYRPVHIRQSVILHNGVDRTVFKRRGHEAQNPSKVFTIGCIGNFEKLKDQMTLLRAVELVSRHRKVKVVLVGGGPELEHCRRYAMQHGLKAEFRSEVQHEHLPSFYHGLDLFVLPSYFEGWGCVYTEAWACGVPFIACKGQGCEGLIPEADRGKWLCRVQDPVDVARKIENYIEHRWPQRLTEDPEINQLVGKFWRQLQPVLASVDCKRSEREEKDDKAFG